MRPSIAEVGNPWPVPCSSETQARPFVSREDRKSIQLCSPDYPLGPKKSASSAVIGQSREYLVNRQKD